MAKRYFSEVKTYEVVIGKSVSGSAPFGTTWLRQIKLHLTRNRFGDNVGIAILEFFEENDLHHERMNGFRNNSTINLNINITNFHDIYNVLRAEKPINLIWQEFEDRYGKSINSWRLSSSREPLAEGDSED